MATDQEYRERLVSLLRKHCPEYRYHSVMLPGDTQDGIPAGLILGYVLGTYMSGSPGLTLNRISGFVFDEGLQEWKRYSGHYFRWLKLVGARSITDQVERDARALREDHPSEEEEQLSITDRRMRAILAVYDLRGDESPLVMAWADVIRTAMEKLEACRGEDGTFPWSRNEDS